MPSNVTIIIPVYNAGKYLHRCVQSILNQTYPHWTTIFVNDGSTDNSLDILENYAREDKRFQIINKPNGGASSARNVGLKAAETDYVMFVDADDSIHPEMLNKVMNAALAHDCNLVITGINFQKKAVGMALSGLLSMNPTQYLKCIPGGPYAKLYKKDILHQYNIRFHEDMHFVEDYVFTTSYAIRAAQYFVIPDALYNYLYDQDDSLMHKFGRREMPFEQYFFCAESPWRIFRELLSARPDMKASTFSAWAWALYNELWKMYYFTYQFLNKNEKRLLRKHFRNRHKDFCPHVHILKRISSPARHPRLYNTVRQIYRTFFKKK